MQDPVNETQETLPLEGETKPQNLEGDPGKVAKMFEEATAKLEYVEETPTETPEVPPEAELGEEPAETTPKETKTTPKKAKKAKKDEPVTKPEEETPIEASTEPKKSKRELFKEKADAESAYRAKEAKLKEREAAAQAAEARYKDFEADPVKFLEAKDPRFYEKLTERYLNEGKTPENAELAAVKVELAAIKEEIKGKHEETKQQVNQAQYTQYMSDTKAILADEEFKAVHDSAALYERFNGQPVNFEQAIAGVWADFHQTYGKRLTPRECCEILLEDAQAHIERVGVEFGQKPAEKKQTPKKKSPPPSGKTLTSEQETQSAPAQEPNFDNIKNKEERLFAISKTLEYEEPPEE